MQHLDRERPADLDVARAIDRAHRAFAEPRLDLVAIREHLADQLVDALRILRAPVSARIRSSTSESPDVEHATAGAGLGGRGDHVRRFGRGREDHAARDRGTDRGDPAEIRVRDRGGGSCPSARRCRCSCWPRTCRTCCAPTGRSRCRRRGRRPAAPPVITAGSVMWRGLPSTSVPSIESRAAELRLRPHGGIGQELRRRLRGTAPSRRRRSSRSATRSGGSRSCRSPDRPTSRRPAATPVPPASTITTNRICCRAGRLRDLGRARRLARAIRGQIRSAGAAHVEAADRIDVQLGRRAPPPVLRERIDALGVEVHRGDRNDATRGPSAASACAALARPRTQRIERSPDGLIFVTKSNCSSAYASHPASSLSHLTPSTFQLLGLVLVEQALARALWIVLQCVNDTCDTRQRQHDHEHRHQEEHRQDLRARACRARRHAPTPAPPRATSPRRASRAGRAASTRRPDLIHDLSPLLGVFWSSFFTRFARPASSSAPPRSLGAVDRRRRRRHALDACARPGVASACACSSAWRRRSSTCSCCCARSFVHRDLFARALRIRIGLHLGFERG